MTKKDQPEPFVTTEQVAEFLGKPVSWVYSTGVTLGIPRYKVGNHLRYRLSEVSAWVEGFRVETYQHGPIHGNTGKI